MNSKTPNLFLIGGMRCGSTSIHYLLSQHPEIFMSKVKEPMFYNAELMRQKVGSGDIAAVALEDFESKGKYRIRSSYLTLFRDALGEKFIGESSHYLYNPDVADIIYQEQPQSKIIVSIRNPYDRIFSEYQYYQREKPRNLSFEDFVFKNCEFDKQGNVVKIATRLNKSFYSKSIKQWMSVFGPSNVKVIVFDDLKQRPVETIKDIYKWLGVDPEFNPVSVHTEKTGKLKNPSIFKKVKSVASKPLVKSLFSDKQRKLLRSWFYKQSMKSQEMHEGTRLKLARIFEDEILELENCLGINLNHWKT